MKKINIKRYGRITVAAAIVLLFAVLSAALITVGMEQSNQSTDSTLPEIILCGEYRIGDGEWMPITEGKHIPATKGDVTLRGYLCLRDPHTKEIFDTAECGTAVSMYLDHISATFTDANGITVKMDNENELFGKGSCAKVWNVYFFEGEKGDIITITLHNPHVFGNETAVDSFLSGLEAYGGNRTDAENLEKGALQRAVGLVIFIFSFIFLSVALFATAIPLKNTSQIWIVGILVLIAGAYFIFSAEGVSLWNDQYLMNTIALGLSMMFYVLVMMLLSVSVLSGKRRLAGAAALAFMVMATLASICVSFADNVLFYDTYPRWFSAASVAAVMLIICLFAELKRNFKDNFKIAVPSAVALAALVADVIATWLGAWQGGLLSRSVFILIMLFLIVVIGNVIPKSIRASIAAKELEAERKSMELKLQESRISIMLSQIQPHFLYNTLNSIYQLCETNPMLARSMVNSFSEYLRNNLSSLDEPGLISFSTELEHINTYLDIEKIRFDDTLEIEYDIDTVDFSVPVLTVQPIVENAVKHGTSKKRGGGKVTISAREEAESYVVVVADTGCGFDPSKKMDDGKRHVGIENVRQRLFNMCAGTLTIESSVGNGTTATIKIPKEIKK